MLRENFYLHQTNLNLYRFAATNWPIVIILFTVIELSTFTGKRQIIIDTDDTSVSVICQIFHEFSIQLAEWVMQ